MFSHFLCAIIEYEWYYVYPCMDFGRQHTNIAFRYVVRNRNFLPLIQFMWLHYNFFRGCRVKIWRKRERTAWKRLYPRNKPTSSFLCLFSLKLCVFTLLRNKQHIHTILSIYTQKQMVPLNILKRINQVNAFAFC